MFHLGIYDTDFARLAHSTVSQFEPGAKSQRAGGYQFGYWHDGTFCRSTKPLPEGSVMKAFYLCSAAGGKRNNFSKSWFSDVMLHGEYPSALIEEENGASCDVLP